MKDSQRFKLRFGKYKTPKFEYDDIVFDEAHGEVRIVGLTDALIPWPIGQPLTGTKRRAIVLFAALVDAVKQEANQAVAHWWGVSGQTVTKWRKALDVGKTPGTTILREERGRENFPKIRDRLLSKSADPERREKIAAARRGKTRPKHVMEILRLSNIGRKASDETRKKLSEANKRRGTRPPKAGKAWTEHEEELARTLTGLRSGELRSITVGQVHLDCSMPYIELAARDEKNRDGSDLPLRVDLAEDIRDWLTSRQTTPTLRFDGGETLYRRTLRCSTSRRGCDAFLTVTCKPLESRNGTTGDDQSMFTLCGTHSARC